MRSVKRLLAGAGAIALLSSAVVVGLGGPASAAPSITVSPNSNLKAGDVVDVTVKGFSPSAPVAIGICKTGRPLKGAGDCGPSKNGASKLSVADASGSATAKITIIVGKLGNTTPPADSCPPCSMSAANIGDASETATVKLDYASTGGGGGDDDGDQPAPEDDGGNAVPPQDGETALPVTGPRETLILALLGYGLLQLGLIAAIRGHRAGPRRTTV